MPTAPRLFSAYVLGRVRLRNRLVMETLASGLATPVGLPGPELIDYYAARARGGVAAIVLEPTRVTPPADALPHLGLYSDAQTPALHDCLSMIKREDCAAFVMLDQACQTDQLDELAQHGNACILAARRARIADADGVMLSTGAGSLFYNLADRTTGQHRLAILIQVIEALVALLGRRFVIGVRLAIEEYLPGGMALQDARLVAHRLVSAGANLLEIDVRVGSDALVALFPGWCVPVAAALRSAVDVPVMVTGEMDDAQIAESTIAEGGADLIGIGERVRLEPDWPGVAWQELADQEEVG